MKLRIQPLPSLIPLCLIGGLLAYPFVWMCFSAFKTNREIYRPLQMLPERFDGAYFNILFSGDWFDFWRAFLNSCLIAGGQAIGAVLCSAMAGFVFARYRVPGKSLLVVLAALTVLLPRQVIALPLYSWLIKLGLTDSLWGVIFPGMLTGIGILFFTQFFKQVPEVFSEAARIEGASEFRLFWMLLPLANAALLTYGLLHFILAWHEHLIPLLVLQSPENMSLPLALSSLFGSSLRYPKAVILCGACMTILPNLVIFTLLYRRAQSALSEFTAS